MRLFARSQPNEKRRILLALSDIHAGHRLGLLSPATVLVKEDDMGRVYYWTPQLGATQQWLWECYQSCLSDAADLAGDDELIVIHDGDATNGDAHGGNIPETTRADQREIAKANLEPLARLPQVRTVRLVTGTAVHVPDCAEARVADDLSALGVADVQAAHHERVTVDGVTFDLAHHGPHPGSRDWLRGNTALYYLKSAIYQDRRLGKEPARCYIRGHFHEYVPVPHEEIWGGQRYRYDLTVIPSFCGLTDFARKVTRSSPALTVGMVAYVVQAGQLTQIEPFLHHLDLRLEEAL